MTRPTPASSTYQPSLLRALRVAAAGLLLVPAVAFAQGISPWERAAANLEVSFTGPLARSLALVATVLGGLMFMYGELAVTNFRVDQAFR